ncbi:MAG: HAMP domain-containing histidine kinase [Acidimicrobiia bacterium]|nr:HAMP domain-containing histidine kinase [Acidimicrobiia bacterium]
MPTRLSVFGVPIPEKAIQRRRVLPVALLLVGALAMLEWHYGFDFSLGILYVIPVVLASAALNRWQIVAFGVFAAVARTPFTPAASQLEALLKFAMATIAYTCTGLLLVEMSNSRRRLLELYAKVQLEQDLRRRAQEQLRILAESSPAAIVTLDAQAHVLAANRAADEMLAVPAGALVGRAVETQLPMFANALRVASNARLIRTSVTGWARRFNDQQFPIQAWFSVYGYGEDRCLAAIVVDMSEEVRDREREHFQHLLDYNRLLASAVSHEIRNLCSAISVVCSNLDQRQDLRGSADFDALKRLLGGLMELASLDLRSREADGGRVTDLGAVLDELRVVIEPDWDEIGGRVSWNVPAELPSVAAGSHGLLQILLNLCQNSLRAVEHQSEPELAVDATVAGQDVVVCVRDNGPGVVEPDQLFHLHATRSSTDGSGLGLYISRELARSMGGELQYVPTARGATFRVTVPQARVRKLEELRVS